MHAIQSSLRLSSEFETSGTDRWASRYRVSDLAVHSIGAVGCAMAELIAARHQTIFTFCGR